MSVNNKKHSRIKKESSKKNNPKDRLDEKTFLGKIKHHAKSFWDYVWNDDSVGSWVVNVILAFIIIKFIVYPLLALVFGTNLPIVAVISGSMHHEGSFDQWWSSQALCSHMQTCTQKVWYSEHNISKEELKISN